MPSTPEFVRAAEIEHEIEVRMTRLFETQIAGVEAARLQSELDMLSDELVRLRTPSFAVAA